MLSRPLIASLRSFLAECGHHISDRHFRSQVLGKLRSSGILISGTPSGYKLVTGTADLRIYLEHGDSIITPMLYRLKCAQETLSSKTEVKVFEEQSFKLLTKLLTTYKESELDRQLQKKQ